MVLKIKENNAFVNIGGGGAAAGVTSFAGRAGVVVPQQNDYSLAQINGLSDALDLKQNKLPVNGVSGQFLAWDMTWRTVVTGGAVWGDITGTIANQTDLTALLAQKVNTVAGKGLSTNDFTTVEKEKLAAIAVGATANRSDAATDDAINAAVEGILDVPIKIPSYLTANVPPAADYDQCIVLINNGTTKVLNLSDGTNWNPV